MQHSLLQSNPFTQFQGLEIELDDEDLSDLEDDVHNEDKNAELSDGELREPSEEGPVEMPVSVTYSSQFHFECVTRL